MENKIIILINGQLIPEKKAFISINSEAFLFGCAVFETLRTYKGNIFNLEGHLNRLKISARIIGIETNYSENEIEVQVNDLCSKKYWPEMKLRIILTKKELIIMAEALQEKDSIMYEKGVKLSAFEGQRTLPEAKKLGDVMCYLAKESSLKKETYDAVLIDTHGYIKECAYANIFWVREGKLFTSDKGILNGITRETVIELSEGCGFEEIKYEHLLKMDEIFITQTSSGILPVTEIEGIQIEKGVPGKLTKELMNKFNKKVWG